MKVLISNDDGIRATGLRILAQEMSKVADIYIAAPLNEKSGTSHGLTTTTPLRVYDHQMDDLTEHAWAVDGTPADCVKLAVDALMPSPPDIVLSGINHGPNLGTDIIYSGTVAAAMEGYLNGFPALALSAAGIRRGKGKGNYLYTAKLAVKLCQQIARDDFQTRVFFNVNVPGCQPEDVQGIVYTYMGWRWYNEPFSKRTDPSGRDYYWLQGQIDDSKCGQGSDVEACNKGFATITPIHADFTDYALLNQLREQPFIFDPGEF